MDVLLFAVFINSILSSETMDWQPSCKMQWEIIDNKVAAMSCVTVDAHSGRMFSVPLVCHGQEEVGHVMSCQRDRLRACQHCGLEERRGPQYDS